MSGVPVGREPVSGLQEADGWQAGPGHPRASDGGSGVLVTQEPPPALRDADAPRASVAAEGVAAQRGAGPRGPVTGRGAGRAGEQAPDPQEADAPSASVAAVRGREPVRPAVEDVAAQRVPGVRGLAPGSGEGRGGGKDPGPSSGGRGVNHDKAHRPRRQDRPQDLLETGAAYAMRADRFRAERHRFFGRTELVRTDPARVLEIDDPHDLARARALAPLLDAPAAALPSREDVDAVVMDFDGTQTDDRVLIDADGRELVAVHRGDGLGVAALRRAGLALLILSTEANAVVAARGRKLAVPVLHGIDRKDLALKQWCDEHGIAPDRVLYVGNDVNDLPCFGLVGWPVAVASAHDAVRGAARAVTSAPGGSGALREIASWLLGPTL
ncbi:HAD hydrolase family protein [Streptomyces sp. NPDC001667]